jgi:DNA polymerase-4
MDVEHDEMGRGWVWGSGRGVVTVRFETAETEPGPVRSYPVDDPALHAWLPEVEEPDPVGGVSGEVAGDGRATSPWSRNKG